MFLDLAEILSVLSVPPPLSISSSLTTTIVGVKYFDDPVEKLVISMEGSSLTILSKSGWNV